MQLPKLAELDEAARIVGRIVPPTLQYAWPLIAEEVGTEVWIKHENHTPIGAFKIRGGLVYFDRLRAREPACRGVITATRGNHGQSVGLAARLHGLSATIVVPRGNSVEKNAAMRALGVTLIEHGEDFQEAREYATVLAAEQGLHEVPAFHRDLVLGVSSYCLEFLRAQPRLGAVYVPIGQGSGICAMIAARAALGHGAEIIGVVSDHAPTYALSFDAGRPIAHAVATQLADGLACRVPDVEALDLIRAHASRIVRVTDDEVSRAMRLIHRATHNLAEGAGAAGLAAILKERTLVAARSVGTVLTGANVDLDVFARAIARG